MQLIATLLSALLSTLAVAAASPIGIHFTDWDGLQSCQPNSYSLPKSEEEIVWLVQNAYRRNETVKVVGSGLSFSGIQMMDGANMIALNDYNKILGVRKLEGSSGDSLVEVQAGAELRTLVQQLDREHGLAMVNLGATATQTIVGAATTGTHGTGAAIGNLASQIVSMRVVDSAGGVHVASEEQNTELFRAAKVGLGAVGIISTVTLRVVPQWKLKLTQVPYSLTALFTDIDSLLAKYDRLQWSFTPYTDDAKLIIRESVPWSTPMYPPAPDGGCWSDTQPVYTADGCVDVSYKALTDSASHYAARSLYTEMEMFIPVEHTMAAVADYIAYMDSEEVKAQHDPNVVVSVMVRYVAGAEDRGTMSPVAGRDSSVLSVIVLGDAETTGNPDEFKLYSSGLETLCAEKYDGRPHWGKVNYATTADIKKAYAFDDSFERFTAVMHLVDPKGMFVNDYLRERFMQE